MRMLNKANLPEIHPYLVNKYTNWYYSIIENALNRVPLTSRSKKSILNAKSILGYCESHHIIPRCMGGENRAFNLVWLTAREHYLCHYLLTKMVNINHSSQMALAVFMMSNGHHDNRYRIPASAYELIKQNMSKQTTGRKLTEEHKEKIRKGGKGTHLGLQPMLGRKHSQESKDKIGAANSKALKGRITGRKGLPNGRKGIKLGKRRNPPKTSWNKGIKMTNDQKLKSKISYITTMLFRQIEDDFK